MKFSKELEYELVPEWRAKYLDYKVGKKKIKAIARTLQKSNRNTQNPTLSRITANRINIDNPASIFSTISPSRRCGERLDAANDSQNLLNPVVAGALNGNEPNGSSIFRSDLISRSEREPLHTPESRFPASAGSYGSISAARFRKSRNPDLVPLELPDPAIDSAQEYFTSNERSIQGQNDLMSPAPVIQNERNFVNPPLAGGERYSGPEAHAPSMSLGRRLMRRIFSSSNLDSAGNGVQLEQLSELDRRQDEFFAFLDSELEKIETFYQTKEEEATQRLQLLRQQLHIMRDRRIEDALAAKKLDVSDTKDKEHPVGLLGRLNNSRLRNTLTGRDHFGKNSEALMQMATPAAFQPRDSQQVTGQRDYTRRRPDYQYPEVSYHSAKRKLKHALQEFYRGLELLKSYAELNRTAFRKMNKKYDKTVNSRPTMGYMSEKVNKSSFVQSEAVDNLMVTVEDLYARYFERGNRKVAVSKLRQLTAKLSGDYSSNTFRSGLLFSAGALSAIQGLILAVGHLQHPDPAIRVQTSYLLQIYAGYFLVVFHLLFFAIDCMIWTRSKINYVFVFEFDPRNALDWRQLSELPCLFLLLLGVSMWLNFTSLNVMYMYWPVLLIGVTLSLVFLPAPVLYHRSRKWWAYSNWRLLLAGLYPVEFRDFFMGDMYCSQVYAMGNIELFFCLYATHWRDPPLCNSSHSRLLGFFTCLPSIWRALQCVRRFSDTRNTFPHLVNFAKYFCSVLYYATLSMYRVDKVPRLKAVFITFALINGVYNAVWDVAMDWSLCNPYAKHPFLRDVLTFQHAWVYYVAMILDVFVRNNWMFYAIFSGEIQHSAILSFFVSFSEVCRRGMWTIFRVENEHCTNVLLFRASRDVPLPYRIPSSPEEQQAEVDVEVGADLQGTPFLAAAELEQTVAATNTRLPARAHRQSSFVGSINRVGSMMATAHRQDFQRKNNAELASKVAGDGAGVSSPDDSSDEEETGNPDPYMDHEIEEEGEIEQEHVNATQFGHSAH